MRFLCDSESFDVLDRAARSLGMDGPGLGTFVELADERLIGIARILGMEELAPAHIGLETKLTIQEDETSSATGPLPEIDMNNPSEPKIYDPDPMPEIITLGVTPLCEICGQPTAGKRYKICSKEECQAERKKRYNREYQRNYKKKSAAEVAGNESGPLASLP